ncbi:MAG: DUF1259 domain-containing protein, partial [Gemmatimonadota bacterium]|nr:DUF1259 domain-containing protein [Gemmatimonadota bacterium]
MNRISEFVYGVVLALAALASAAGAQSPQPDSALRTPLERTLGRPGVSLPGGVVKFSFPRTDLTVVADGVKLEAVFALGGWVGFKKTGRGMTMAMGDLVLTEDEVNPVMLALQAGGVDQTAVHNHLLGELPRIIYVHIAAHGDEARVAAAIHNAIAATKIPAASPPSAVLPTDLDVAGIAKMLGYTGRLNGVVYQVSVPRPENI